MDRTLHIQIQFKSKLSASVCSHKFARVHIPEAKDVKIGEFDKTNRGI